MKVASDACAQVLQSPMVQQHCEPHADQGQSNQDPEPSEVAGAIPGVLHASPKALKLFCSADVVYLL